MNSVPYWIIPIWNRDDQEVFLRLPLNYMRKPKVKAKRIKETIFNRFINKMKGE